MRGDAGGEEFEPRFTYHGFRFVEVVMSNFGAPTMDDIEAHVVRSSVDTVGHIEFFSGTRCVHHRAVPCRARAVQPSDTAFGLGRREWPGADPQQAATQYLVVRTRM